METNLPIVHVGSAILWAQLLVRAMEDESALILTQEIIVMSESKDMKSQLL
jgi:hypothetical protein